MAARQIAMGDGDRGDPVEAGACPDHGRGPSADEHERESADELRKKLGGKVVLHFDLLIRTIWAIWRDQRPWAPRLGRADRRVDGPAPAPSREAVRSGNPGSR